MFLRKNLPVMRRTLNVQCPAHSQTDCRGRSKPGALIEDFCRLQVNLSMQIVGAGIA